MADAKASAVADASDKTERKQSGLIPYVPGQSGNPKGRPKGARNKLGEAFLEDMLSAWQAQGKDAIERVIAERPHEFIKAVAGILPKELSVTTTSVQELSDDELSAALAALRSVGALAHAGSGGKAAQGHEPPKALRALQ